jgi:hypothetical protein
MNNKTSTGFKQLGIQSEKLFVYFVATFLQFFCPNPEEYNLYFHYHKDLISQIWLC